MKHEVKQARELSQVVLLTHTIPEPELQKKKYIATYEEQICSRMM